MTLFEFLMMIAAVVIAIGLTEIIGGWGRMLRTNASVKFDWLLCGWCVFVLLWLVLYWLGMWSLNAVEIKYQAQVLFLIIPTLFGVLAAYAMTPNVPMDGELDLRAYYIEKRASIFGPLVVFSVVTPLADYVLVGFDQVGIWIGLLSSGFFFCTTLTLAITKKIWVHIIGLCLSLLIIVGFYFGEISFLTNRWAP
ncbi:MAG: hypothetical protein AB8B93_10360 [Pseudomonadales bacterium]